MIMMLGGFLGVAVNKTMLHVLKVNGRLYNHRSAFLKLSVQGHVGMNIHTASPASQPVSQPASQQASKRESKQARSLIDTYTQTHARSFARPPMHERTQAGKQARECVLERCFGTRRPAK